jgi:hypothetical protein
MMEDSERLSHDDFYWGFNGLAKIIELGCNLLFIVELFEFFEKIKMQFWIFLL